VQLRQPRIALFAEPGTARALNVLGFPYDQVSTDSLNDGAIAGYDLFINPNLRWSSLSGAGQASFLAFFGAGGDYIGLGSRGVGFAQSAALFDFTSTSAEGNAIVSLAYSPADSLAAGFPAQDSAFVFTPVWFTSLGTGVETTASLLSGDFFVSGFWPGWQGSGAAGYPVIVHGTYGGTGDGALFGIDATFRGHPENAFRLVGNAIFDAID
jgi:hypothetical protein